MKQKKWIILFCTAVGIVLAGLLGWQVYRDWFSYNEHPDLSQKVNSARLRGVDIVSATNWEHLFWSKKALEDVYIGVVQEKDENNAGMFEDGHAAFLITKVIAEGKMDLLPGDIIEIGFSGSIAEEVEARGLFRPGDKILGILWETEGFTGANDKKKYYTFFAEQEGMFYLDAGDRLRSLSDSPLASKYDGLPKQRLINDLKNVASPYLTNEEVASLN